MRESLVEDLKKLLDQAAEEGLRFNLFSSQNYVISRCVYFRFPSWSCLLSN
jgi:hypothetical protein